MARLGLFLSFGMLLLGQGSIAHAACSTPTGQAGALMYDTTDNVVNFCDGTNWRMTGASIPSASTTGCTTPTGTEGQVIYNNTHNVVQFCNGDDWVNMGAENASAGTTGCTSPAGTEGQMIYSSTASWLQYCDGENWVNAGQLNVIGGVATALNVADVFSTDLWTGNSSSQSISNGIDLASEGGMVWIKYRGGTTHHALYDTNRGILKRLITNEVYSEQSDTNSLTSFNSFGYSLGADSSNIVNFSSRDYVGWTFRKAPKFFDVVTYTGNGASNRQISHNLGIEPGMIIIKRTDGTWDWLVYHKSNTANPETDYLLLNSYSKTYDADLVWNDTPPSNDVFTVGYYDGVNASGSTYVAYLFAHDDSDDGLIQCGSYTGNGSTSGPTVTLGWEPQWLMIKRIDSAANWFVADAARGLGAGNDPLLFLNDSNAELDVDRYSVTPTGFQIVTDGSHFNNSGSQYIYCAIRKEGS